MGAVVGCGALIMAIMAWMQKSVLTDPECVPPVKRDAKKKKVLNELITNNPQRVIQPLVHLGDHTTSYKQHCLTH